MRKLPLVALLCWTLLAHSGAWAQAETPAEEQAAKPMTAPEQIAAGEMIVNRGTTLSRRVRNMLNEARKANDIIKTTCLNDKLTQINANLRNAQLRLESLRNAANPDVRGHEYTVLTVLGQKLDVLEQEAGQCVGEDMFETGATNVTTEINDSVVPVDEVPSSPPVVLPPTLPTIPPPASGMM